MFYVRTLCPSRGNSQNLGFPDGAILQCDEALKPTDGWTEGKYDERTGLFSMEHVELLPQVQALCDFTAFKAGDLRFKAGDLITVIEGGSMPQWMGLLQGGQFELPTIGRFPAKYVEEICHPPAVLAVWEAGHYAQIRHRRPLYAHELLPRAKDYRVLMPGALRSASALRSSHNDEDTYKPTFTLQPTYKNADLRVESTSQPVHSIANFRSESTSQPAYRFAGFRAESTTQPAHTIPGVRADSTTQPTYAIAGFRADSTTQPTHTMPDFRADSTTQPTYNIAGFRAESTTQPTYNIPGFRAESTSQPTYSIAGSTAESIRQLVYTQVENPHTSNETASTSHF